MGPVKSFLNDHEGDILRFPIGAQAWPTSVELNESGSVSHSVAAQKIFPVMLAEPDRKPLDIASSNNWLQNSNTSELETFVDEVISAMPDKVEAYRKGKKDSWGCLSGK